jgi:hypothetical protein
MRRVNLFVIVLVIAAPAAAEIYQWRDAQGKLHYADTPPASGNATTLRPAAQPAVRPPSVEPANTEPAGANPASGGPASETGKVVDSGKPAAEAAKPKTYTEKEVEFRQRRAEAAEASAKAEQERQKAAARLQECERARIQLTALQSGQRIARFNSKGDREVLDDAARAEETVRTRQMVDATCK